MPLHAVHDHIQDRLNEPRQFAYENGMVVTEVRDGYAKGDDFKVTVNGQEIKPNADGKYVVENVTSDLEIVVSGVEKVKAPAPTTETPKTGDEGLFLPLMLFMLSGIACVSLIAFKKKFRF